MTWCCTRLEDVGTEGDEAHVHPAYEEHIIDRGCWCGPKRIDGVDVFPIYLHHDNADLKGPRDPSDVERADGTFRPADPISWQGS